MLLPFGKTFWELCGHGPQYFNEAQKALLLFVKTLKPVTHVLQSADGAFVIRKNTNTLPNFSRGAEGASTIYKNE